MEDSPLNLAHYHGRRAENHVKHRRFDKAIDHSIKAVDFTEEALKITSSPISIKSLSLQLEDHKRQLNLIKLKKAAFEKYLKEFERQRDADPTRKKSPSSTGTLQVIGACYSDSPSSKITREGSVDVGYGVSILEIELEPSEIPHLAPLELPPQLDFASFRYNKMSDNTDL